MSKKPVATITTIEGRRHYSGPPGGYGLWDSRPAASVKPPAFKWWQFWAKRRFYHVKREN